MPRPPSATAGKRRGGRQIGGPGASAGRVWCQRLETGCMPRLQSATADSRRDERQIGGPAEREVVAGAAGPEQMRRDFFPGSTGKRNRATTCIGLDVNVSCEVVPGTL